MKDIKETKEILEAVKEGFKVGKAVRDIIADGADMSDLPAVFNLVKEQADKLDVYADAIENAKLAEEEIKDLDKAEIIELLMIIVEGISEVEKA